MGSSDKLQECVVTGEGQAKLLVDGSLDVR
jgi:hypothetical protein